MITPEQLRAAKAILDWSFETFAQKTGMTGQGLMNIASGKTKPQTSTSDKLLSVLETHGIELLEGGARLRQDIVTIYEGRNCFIRLLDDAYLKLSQNKGEFLTSASDDSRSTSEVVEKLRIMKKAGIKMRSLIRNKDTYLLGSTEEYRWMPEGMFVDSDCKIIYGDTVAYFMSWLGTPRVIAINDKAIAQEATRTFDFIWEQSTEPPHSTSDVRLEE